MKDMSVYILTGDELEEKVRKASGTILNEALKILYKRLVDELGLDQNQVLKVMIGQAQFDKLVQDQVIKEPDPSR